MVEFVAEENHELVSLGLEPPQGEIFIGTEGNSQPQHLLIGKSPEGKENLYAKLESKANIVLVAVSAKDLLKKEVTELRDKHLFSTEPDQVVRLELTQNQQSWQFEKKDGKWEGEVQEAMRQLPLLSFLRLALGVSAADIFPPNGITVLKGLGTAPEKPLFTLTIGAKVDNGPEYYAKLAENPEIYILSAGQVDNLLKLIPPEKPSP